MNFFDWNLFVVWLIGTTPVVNEAAQIAQVINESIKLCDVVGYVAHSCNQETQ